MAKLDARSLSPASQEDLRRRVVRAVTEEGMTQVEAAQVFGVSRQAVNGWLKQYRRNGSDGLTAKPRGRPARPRLTAAQARQVQRWIRDRCPDQLKLPFVLWTREAVQQLIAERIGIRVSVWTVGRYLKSWGMTPQKPVCRAYERNPEAVARWLEVDYPQIREEAKQEGATIWWEDEMGMRSDDQGGRTYGVKGQTPVVLGTGQRFRCSIISALTNRGQLCFRVFHDNLNSDVFIDFMKRLLRHCKAKIFLIVDRHPSHRSRQTLQWVEEHSDKIRLIFLPAYSPDLNPDEVLNQDVKANAVRRQRPHNLIDMIENVISYMRSTQRRRDLVRRYFHEASVKYAAA